MAVAAQSWNRMFELGTLRSRLFRTEISLLSIERPEGRQAYRALACLCKLMILGRLGKVLSGIDSDAGSLLLVIASLLSRLRNGTHVTQQEDVSCDSKKQEHSGCDEGSEERMCQRNHVAGEDGSSNG